jgi:hypothetical protein
MRSSGSTIELIAVGSTIPALKAQRRKAQGVSPGLIARIWKPCKGRRSSILLLLLHRPFRAYIHSIPTQSGRRAAFAAHLPQNRTCAVRIRLFGMAGYYSRHRPVHDLMVPGSNISCTGALMAAQVLRKRSSSETSPRSAKYALRSPRSTAGVWDNAQIDWRPL